MNVKAALRIVNQNVLKQKLDLAGPECEPNVSAELEADLTFLKSATEPYTRILHAWEATYGLRNKLYRDSTIGQIFEDFPCLKEEYALELVIFFVKFFQLHYSSIIITYLTNVLIFFRKYKYLYMKGHCM